MHGCIAGSPLCMHTLHALVQQKIFSTFCELCLFLVIGCEHQLFIVRDLTWNYVQINQLALNESLPVVHTFSIHSYSRYMLVSCKSPLFPAEIKTIVSKADRANSPPMHTLSAVAYFVSCLHVPHYCGTCAFPKFKVGNSLKDSLAWHP